MASNKKPKNPTGVSPIGIFKFPKLNEPDYGTDEFPKPNGEYSDQLILEKDAPEVQAWLAGLAPLHAEAIEKAHEEFGNLKLESRKKLEKNNGKGGIQVNDLYTEVYDEETEEPTGEIVVKFAMTASGIYKKGPKEGKKWHRKPSIFDAAGNLMKKPPSIWGGTKGQVSYEIRPYFIPGTGAAGLKLGLQAVMIHDLVTAGERSANSYGFNVDKNAEGYRYEALTDSDDEDEERSVGGKQAGTEAADDEDNTDF